MEAANHQSLARLIEPAILATVVVALVGFGAWALATPASRTHGRTIFLSATVTGLVLIVASMTLNLAFTGALSASGAPRPLFLLLSAFLVPTVTMIGWFVSGEIARERDLQLHDDDRAKAEAERQQRQRDVMLAVRADIFPFVRKYRGFDFETHRDRMVARIAAGAGDTPPYSPFLPRISGALLWDGISKDIPILPEQAIETIVLYYDTRNALRLFVEDMSTDVFRALAVERRTGAYKDYIGMLKSVYSYAESAVDAIDRALPQRRQ